MSVFKEDEVTPAPVMENEQRIHVKAFLGIHPELSNIQKAGFMAYADGTVWMVKSKWDSILTEYLAR